jgi:carbamoyltransferase
MIVLGISDNHESHACVVVDGKLVSAISEERLSKLKSDSRYPRQAISKALEIAGVEPDQIDLVAFGGSSAWVWQSLYNKIGSFSVSDWIKEMDVYWHPKLIEGKDISPFKLFDVFCHKGGEDLRTQPYYPMIEKCRNLPVSEWQRVGDECRARAIEEDLGIPANKIVTFRHEDCHKAYGFHSSPYERAPAIVLTVEGGGDDSSVTVSTTDAQGNFTEHWKSNRVQLGRLYHYVTLILGMKPGQHEYKVMGLAPYGTEYHGRATLEFFNKIHSVDGIEILNNDAVKDLYFSVLEGTRGHRFDGIAWALQSWLENILCEWVGNCVEKFGVRNVVLSGGVGQNIKACKRLLELDCVDQFWVGPISGDGSIAIGAAWLATKKCGGTIDGLSSIYLGTEYGRRDVENAMERTGVRSHFQVVESPSPGQAAEWLAEGKVVARFSGRMEFGQRALGNRSILADPRHGETVERVNNKIKYRDFWMPFTPSMTFEQADKMLVNGKRAYSPFMTMAFDLQSEFKNSIPAATHPADKTVRPQMLRPEANPGYHELIKAFGKRSGIECLMNTSFNLHGEPIVESPSDAIHTFERSDIDVLLFDDFAVSREQA